MPSELTLIAFAFGVLVALAHAGGLGTVRLTLALLVVGSHVGALGATSAGGVGIGGFFAISGFLMARTIAANYAGSGFARFYANRFIRLAPPLLAVMGLTILLLHVRDGVGFQIKPGRESLYMPVEFPPSTFHWFQLGVRSYPTFLLPQFYTLPQAWSLVTEGCFYLVAPLAAWLLSRRAGFAVALASAASAVLTAAAMSGSDDVWLRSPFASFWIFGLGMLTFHGAPVRPAGAQAATALRLLSTGVLACLVLLAFGYLPVSSGITLVLTPLLMLAWLWLSQASGHVPASWDRQLGNWSYGVFLGHFLSTMTMYWIAEGVYRSTGLFGLFGVPDDSELRLVSFSYLFALVTGAGVYYVVERPFERLRAVIRTRRERRVETESVSGGREEFGGA